MPSKAAPAAFTAEWQFVSVAELADVLAGKRRWAVMLTAATDIDGQMTEMVGRHGFHVHSVTIHARCATCNGVGTVRDKRSRGPLFRQVTCKACKGHPDFWSRPAERGDHFPDERVP